MALSCVKLEGQREKPTKARVCANGIASGRGQNMLNAEPFSRDKK